MQEPRFFIYYQSVKKDSMFRKTLNRTSLIPNLKVIGLRYNHF